MTPEHDGKRYAFPGNTDDRSGWDALRWAVTRRPTRWPRWIDNPPAAELVERVEGAELRVTFINHATVLIQSAGLNILTDPVWSRRASPSRFAGPARHRAPGIAFDELPPIDALLISHNHYDHLDLVTIERLWRRDRPRVLAPLGNASLIHRAGETESTELNWWDSLALDERVRVHLVPARHWSSRGVLDANRALWGGYAIELPGGQVYFAGDTGYGDGEHFRQARERLGAPRLALLPIGAYEPRWFMKPQHMNPQEAVRALGDLDAELALAIHFGTFQLTDEAHDAPPQALARALSSAGIDSSRFRVLANGEAWTIGTAV